MSHLNETAELVMPRLERSAWWVGAGGLALCLAGYLLGRLAGDASLLRKVFFSYLYAYLFFLGLGLGSLAWWMIHQLTGGAWGQVLQRTLSAGSRTLPLLTLLFLPLLAGLDQLYVWVAPQSLLAPLPAGSRLDEELHHLLEHKSPYLNIPFFLVRAALYFAIWVGAAGLLNRWAVQVDRTQDVALARRMQIFSGRALVLVALAATFAAFDWLMSLEPTWYSTIFGVVVGVSELLAALAGAIAVVCWLAPRTSWGQAVTPEVWNDLGNLLLATVMLWAYVSFSQLLLIWSGNLPREISWYLIRAQGGWEYVGAALALFYFAVPFLLLLSRQRKRDPRRLQGIAWLLVGMGLVHHFWLVNPVYSRLILPRDQTNSLTLHWLDLTAVLGVGGIWLGSFLHQLRRRPLTPPPDLLLLEEATPHA